MLHPLLEGLPNYVISVGRKNPTSDQVVFLKGLISRLEGVACEDLANAYNKIGIIHVYLNEFEMATEAFGKSLSSDFNEVVFSNYLVTLDTSGKYKKAIQEGLSFIERNPNNKRVFSVVSEIIYRYPKLDDFNTLLRFFKYQFDGKECLVEEKKRNSQVKKNLEVLERLDINQEYYQFVTNLAFSEVAKIQMGSTNFNSYYNQEVDQLLINVSVFGIEKEDIKVLNKNFDDRLGFLIENKEVSFDTYVDHLLKFAFSFTTNSSSQLVA